jgi:hypothetical protein
MEEPKDVGEGRRLRGHQSLWPCHLEADPEVLLAMPMEAKGF